MARSFDSPADFERTLRALQADVGPRVPLLALASLAVLVVAGSWMALGEVPVYVVTEHARVQAVRDEQQVAAPVAGVVREVRARPGSRVAAGDVLYRLDATVAERSAAGVREELEGLRREWLATRRERLGLVRRLDGVADLAAARGDEARSRAEAAAAVADLADREAERAERLAAEDLVPQRELERLRTESSARRAEAAAAGRSLARLAAEASVERQEILADLAALDGRLARLRGQIGGAAQALGGRSAEVERLTVRAPWAGRVEGMRVRAAGAVVGAGEVLAVLVPEARMGAVAWFAPGEAIGRIEPGQRAELRLDAFPWTEHGALPARVLSVEEESGGERVRVGLALDHADTPGRRHGLRATAVIEVGRRTPARLLLARLGRLGPPRGRPAAR